MSDWARRQATLTRAGYPCGAIDGHDGPKTWSALLAFVADRPADAAIREIAARAAKALAADAITATPARLAEFLAQIANETGGFTRFEEDLHYSAEAMLRYWPDHFTLEQARAAVDRPIEIAGRAYGGRMGNAAWPSLDGYSYRGRGCLQLTGRAAYARFGALTGLPLVAQPDLAADPADSLTIAIAFWRERNVNAAVDRGDFAQARRLTNGGAIGLAAVAARRARLLTIL